MPCVTIWRDTNDEYQVPAPDFREASAYYTDDRRDAVDTLTAMWTRGPAAITTRAALSYRVQRCDTHPTLG